jgi:beta-phosphoglucomutase-like phosphatase (HAD superfamily)
VIAAGDQVPAKKPAPDIYELALQLLGVPAADCIALEDTLNGLRSAAGAGLRCVVTVSAYGGTGPFHGAAAVLTSLGDTDEPCAALAGPAPQGGLAELDYLDGLPAAGA